MQRHQLFLLIRDTFPIKDRLSERIQTDRTDSFFPFTPCLSLRLRPLWTRSGDKDPASSRPTGEAGFVLADALGTTPIGERRVSHFHKETKKVCDDADLLPAATLIQALHDYSTEEPVTQIQTTTTTLKDYMAVL